MTLAMTFAHFWALFKDVILLVYLVLSGLTFLVTVSAIIYVRLGGEINFGYSSDDD